MTVKQFFKSTSFKCIVALLCVLLVSGIFLTIMNGLLLVTDEERFDRAINKIYGKSVTTESISVANYNSNATIEEAYKIKDDGNYLVKSTGKGGFDNGTITCWVVIEVSGGKVSGVGKVVVDSNKGQTQMAEIKDSFLNKFSEEYTDGIYYSTDDGFLVANSTKSSNAVCNAVNGALDFVNALFGNVAEDIYADFDYIGNIETLQTSHVYNSETGEVIFTVVSKGYGHSSNFTSEITVNANGIITSFEIIKFGSTNDNYNGKAQANAATFVSKDLAGILEILGNGTDYPGDNANVFPTSGASESTYSLYTAALFATANYDKCMPSNDNNADTEGGEENE